jgi:hypothetical protein
VLESISTIIDANPTIGEHVLQGLKNGKVQARRTGANGMSVDQVLSCGIVKVFSTSAMKGWLSISSILSPCDGFAASAG